MADLGERNIAPDRERMDTEARLRGSLKIAARKPDLRQRAERAIANTRRFEPSMGALARKITGRPDIKVQVKANVPSSMTDGKIIYVKPEPAMGDDIAHVQRLCDKVDADGHRLCPACALLDDVSFKLHHEVAHIAYGSFDTLHDADKLEVMSRAIAERGNKRAAALQKAIDDAEAYYGGLPAMSAAGIISPFLPTILNALEDARVNRAMCDDMPGLERIALVRTRDTMRDGIAIEDGTVQFWQDRTPTEQAIIGLYIAASGYDEILDFLDPAISKIIRGKDIDSLIFDLRHSRSIATVYRAGFLVLEALRAHGLCRRPDDIDEPEQDEDKQEQPGGKPEDTESCENEDDAKGEGDGQGTEEDAPDKDESSESGDKPSTSSGGGEDSTTDEASGAQADDEGAQEVPDKGDQGDDTTVEEDDNAEDKTGQAGDGADANAVGEASDDGEDGYDLDPDEVARMMERFTGHEEDGSVEKVTEPDELLERVIEAVEAQRDHFDAPSHLITGVHVHKWGHPIYNASGGNRSLAMAWCPEREDAYMPRLEEKLIGPSVMKARMVFGENKAVHQARGLRRGNVDSGRLALVGTGERRVFKKTTQPDDRDYFALLGLDVSGSTMHSGCISLIRQIGRAMGEVFHRINVDFGMYAHTGCYDDFIWDGGYRMRFAGEHEGRGGRPLALDIFEIKAPEETWASAQPRLAALTPAHSNLDGHTLEFYRKVVEAQRQRVKMLFYVTDGAMPLENYAEELEILQREIKLCRKAGIHLIGIGVGNDDPNNYGLDTIRVDSASDLPRLIREVEKRITR